MDGRFYFEFASSDSVSCTIPINLFRDVAVAAYRRIAGVQMDISQPVHYQLLHNTLRLRPTEG